MNILDEIGGQELLNNVVTLSEAKMKFGREAQRRKDSLDTSRNNVATAANRVRVTQVNARIIPENGKFFVTEKSGDKKLSKGYNTKAEAFTRLGQITSLKKKNAVVASAKKDRNEEKEEKINKIIAVLSGKTRDIIHRILNVVSSSHVVYPIYLGGKELYPYGDSLKIGCDKLAKSLRMESVKTSVHASITNEHNFKTECIAVESQLAELMNKVPVEQVGIKRHLRSLLADLQPFKTV